MSKTMLFNPYSGRPRNPLDIQSDPEGILMLDPDEPIRAAPAPQPSADPWRNAVDQMLLTSEQTASDDPRESIDRLIDWHVSVAMDPLVSSDARALIQRGRDEVAAQPSAEPSELVRAARTVVNEWREPNVLRAMDDAIDALRRALDGETR
jgi:hypothetical protein